MISRNGIFLLYQFGILLSRELHKINLILFLLIITYVTTTNYI